MDKRPIVLVVMDGIGISKETRGNAVARANKPTLDRLTKECPNILLKAHGVAVGLPSDEDMGNSEVGHNALGCGQIYSQGAKLVNESIATGKMFISDTWRKVINNCIKNSSGLHFIGLLSDGNVHSNIEHLKAMLKHAKADGINEARIHILLDGRDVDATSALKYVDILEKTLDELNDNLFIGKIASGGGRMKVTMDRYEADWNMVNIGWKTHVEGNGRFFASATEAIETYRKELNVIDQDLPAFVISENGKAVGDINENDSVILFNFRGDRAIELSMAFDLENFDKFKKDKNPKVVYAGMLQYDGDLLLPRDFLVTPPDIKNTLTEYLITFGVRQYAISETQKFGHVTYFWNGNKSGKFSDQLETFVEIPSDKVSFDERPWMKCAEITDELIIAISSDEYDFLRVNYPNGDMVGHTGNIDATEIGVEAVDLILARLLPIIDKKNAILLITADHGNADEMYEKTKDGSIKAKTSHTLNPVPFIVYDKEKVFNLKNSEEFGLANVAATVVDILGLRVPDIWEESMLEK